MLSNKDLMIGDWVCFNGDENHEYPVQIDDISKEEAGVDGDWFDIWEPIPLTREILEKNGFHTYSDASQEWFIGVFKDGNKYLELTYIKGDIEWTINGDEYSIVQLKYVHELQHALKLCRIEKEIIL